MHQNYSHKDLLKHDALNIVENTDNEKSIKGPEFKSILDTSSIPDYRNTKDGHEIFSNLFKSKQEKLITPVKNIRTDRSTLIDSRKSDLRSILRPPTEMKIDLKDDLYSSIYSQQDQMKVEGVPKF